MIRPNLWSPMRVETTDNRGYESINDGCMLVLNCDKGLTIKSVVLFHHVPEQRARIKELAQHLMQWVETGSLVIPEPTSKDVMDMRQKLIDDGCLTDFNGAPITIDGILNNAKPISKDAREWLEADKKMLDEVMRLRLKEMAEEMSSSPMILMDKGMVIKEEPKPDG